MPRAEHIPLELLQTFACIADLDGDATSAAHTLQVSQPTISKRLSALRRLTASPDRQPWLLLKGKRWKVTVEGQRVRGVVTDLVGRYEQMQQFVAGQQLAKSIVSIACGQQAATGFVKTAIERFLKEHPECRLRLSTPRGKARIEGVAGGQFDLAIVTDSPATIHRIARMELYIETLFEDVFVLVANPPARSPWGRQWHGLPSDRPVTADELLGLPFILPEPDASRRQQFEEWIHQATGQLPNVILETGGWQTILDFVASGVGVGIVPKSSIEVAETPAKRRFACKSLDTTVFPAEPVRLISRRLYATDAPALSEQATFLASYLSSKSYPAQDQTQG